MQTRLQIPGRGRSADALLDDMASFRTDDARYRDGRTWSMVYWVDDAHHELLQKAANLYSAENALNPMAFRSLKRMETEVVAMTASLLNGPETCVGVMTSGGTESLLLAVKTYRDRARKKWPYIRRPNMVMPETAHVALDKAAHLFGVRIRRVKAGADGRADMRDYARKIDRNTVLLVGSAPQYPHGSVDPIAEIGQLAEKKGLPLHVDACFGGFMLPWLEKLGVPVPTWDFRIPGVSSISADAHKYGYAPKGASLIVYRDMELMKHQFFVATGWAGGIYASPSLPGSRPGGPIAATWAALGALGEEGYLRLARGAWEASERLRAGIREIPGLKILGLPHSPIVTWAASDPAIGVYAVADILHERGWAVDRQQMPPSVHCTVNANNGPVIDEYLADLRDAVREVRAHPELSKQGEAAVYGLMSRVPVRGLVDRAVGQVMEKMYAPGVIAPDLADAGDDPAQKVGERVLGFIDRLRGRGSP